jgi:2-polyprenyl-3-methyl-5-hydroxy-6-metoxy-1,4-benzoquinol methylase
MGTVDHFEANKHIWNQRTILHKNSSFYNREGFLKGETALNSIELNELGNVKGASLLHLQCHFGMDSLDWARRGAAVTAIDISDEAIREAELLKEELKLPGTFICCNVYDIDRHIHSLFDIVFTSYGVIGWLPDLERWAQLIADRLKPGGIFYMAEFHPVVWMFDEEFTHVKYHYDNRELIITENEGTYTDRNASIIGKEYSWNHSLGEVLNALLKAGLQLQLFNEYMYSPYPCFRNMVELEKGQWQIRGIEGKIPMVYSLKMTKAT